MQSCSLGREDGIPSRRNRTYKATKCETARWVQERGHSGVTYFTSSSPPSKHMVWWHFLTSLELDLTVWYRDSELWAEVMSATSRPDHFIIDTKSPQTVFSFITVMDNTWNCGCSITLVLGWADTDQSPQFCSIFYCIVPKTVCFVVIRQ